MRRLALISDIHGNGVALDAVLADLAHQRLEEIVCLGDIAAGGPQPPEVVARLRELRCAAVRGNADGWLLEGLPRGRSEETRRLRELVGWARTRLGPNDVDYLDALPATLTIAIDDLGLFCFHGSPRSDVDRLLPTTPVLAGGVEVAFRRVAVDVSVLAEQTASMPHRTWAVDLERRIERWNAQAVS